MLGSRVKDEVRSSRGRAAGIPSRQRPLPRKHKTTVTAPPVEPAPAFAAEPESELESQEIITFEAGRGGDVDSDGSGGMSSEQLADEKAKQKAKVDKFVQSRLTRERNSRLRQGKGYMSKAELKAFKASVRAEAYAKYPLAGEGGRPASADAAANGTSDGLGPCDFAEAHDVLPNHSPIVHKPFQLSRPSSSRNIAAGQSARTASYDRTDVHRSAREEARRFLEARTSALQACAPEPAAAPPADMVSTDAPAAEAQPGDDAWWEAEEARWRAELAHRRQEGLERQQQVANGSASADAGFDVNPGASPEPESGTNDISLRSVVVSKSTADRGLGIQLFTPSNEQGVRITKIDPIGPFGRTGMFEDGDVIVEIDGTPLLYGGHTAVLAAIQSAMARSGEMNVTVCSPDELSKLEVLVDTNDTVATRSGNDNRQSRRTSSGGSWKLGWSKVVSSMSERTKAMMRPIGNVFARSRAYDSGNGTTGTLRGAPAWWREVDAKKLKAVTDGSNARAAATASEHSPRGSSPDPSVARRLNFSGADGSDGSGADNTPELEPAYLIYRADINDLERYRGDYMSKTTQLITKFGGRWLARGGKVANLEGGDASGGTVLQRMVLIEFPSMQHAKDFFHSEEYQEARQARLSIATAELTVLEGMLPQTI